MAREPRAVLCRPAGELQACRQCALACHAPALPMAPLAQGPSCSMVVVCSQPVKRLNPLHRGHPLAT